MCSEGQHWNGCVPRWTTLQAACFGQRKPPQRQPSQNALVPVLPIASLLSVRRESDEVGSISCPTLLSLPQELGTESG